MQALNQSVRFDTHRAETISVYPLGDVGDRIAGRYRFYADVGSGRAAGYKPESFMPWHTLQDARLDRLSARPPLGDF
jgi:hypothetical protein